MKTSQKVEVLETEVANLCELAGETLATCMINLKRMPTRRNPLSDFDKGMSKQYLTARIRYLKAIEKRLRVVKG
jgi:hypothetical protein